MRVSYIVPNFAQFLIDRSLSPRKFPVIFRGAKSTCSNDCLGKIHYYERSPSVGLRPVYLLHWCRAPTYNLASVYLLKFCRVARM